MLEPAGWVEILAQRMVWSLVVVAILLAVTKGFSGVRAVLRDPPRLLRLTAAGLLIMVNWGVYIWGVNAGHVVECSLGYFINPLFTILLGVVVLKERLRIAQWVAVGIGTVAVLVIADRLRAAAVDRAGAVGELRPLRLHEEAGAHARRRIAVHRDRRAVRPCRRSR